MEDANQESVDSPPVHPLCPNCGQRVDPAKTSGPVVECPHCHTQFFSQATDTEDSPAIESQIEQTSADAELSGLRIKQMSALRRTAYRTRSYFIVGTVCCAAVAIDFVVDTISELRHRHRFTAYTGLYICLSLAAFIGAWMFWQRTMQVHRDIRASIKERELEELEISKQERDFSALSDGSHQAKNLEQIFDPNDDRPQTG